MRILHTADWHLGRVFHQLSLLDDQAVLLDQIAGHVASTDADALIIAGDVFDRANPRTDAVDLFDRFLARVYRDTRAAIVVIAGNHDAPERIGYGGALHDPRRVLIRGPLHRSPAPLVLTGSAGPVAISALPFADVFAARRHFGDDAVRTPADVIDRQMAEARDALPQLTAAPSWIVVAHAFAAGGAVSESERALDQVGGLATVPTAAFGDAAYVALGHLHRAQAVGARHIRYAGAPMAYGFDEADRAPSLTLAEIGADGLSLTEIPLAPPRPLRVIDGRFDDLIRAGADGSDALVKIRLLDPGPIHDAIGRLRAVFPHVLQLEWFARADCPALPAAAARRRTAGDPAALFAEFFHDVTGDALSDDGRRTIDAVAAAVAQQPEA